MKILFLSNLYPPNDVGGYERLAFHMASALVTRGHSVHVLTSDYGGRAQDYQGQTIERELHLLAKDGDIYAPFEAPERTIAAWNNSNLLKVAQAVDRYRPDVVFVWNLYFFDRSILDGIRAYAGRCVFLLTDNWLISFLKPSFLGSFFASEVYGEKPKRWNMLARVRSAVVSSGPAPELLQARAIFPSSFMASLHSRAGIAFTHATVIPHGVEFSQRAAGQLVPRERLVQDGKLRLLFAGRVVPIKGAHTAIRALPRVIAELPRLSVTLDVVGDQRDAAYHEQLHSEVVALGTNGHVRFLPPVEETNLFGLFQAYDIYLFPSLYEPFSLTLIHAMEAGIPIVASAAGGNTDVIRNGSTGLTFPPGDEAALAKRVVSLAKRDRLRRGCAGRARELGKQLTFERMVSAVERYLELAAGVSRGTPGRALMHASVDR